MILRHWSVWSSPTCDLKAPVDTTQGCLKYSPPVYSEMKGKRNFMKSMSSSVIFEKSPSHTSPFYRHPFWWGSSYLQRGCISFRDHFFCHFYHSATVIIFHIGGYSHISQLESEHPSHLSHIHNMSDLSKLHWKAEGHASHFGAVFVWIKTFVFISPRVNLWCVYMESCVRLVWGFLVWCVYT